MRVLGVDPGKSGAFVVVEFRDGKAILRDVQNIPTSEGEYLWGTAMELLPSEAFVDVMVVEYTKNVRCGPEGRSNPGALASLSECRGGFEAIAAVRSWDVVRVAPRTWQSVMFHVGIEPAPKRKRGAPKPPKPTKVDTGHAAKDALARMGVAMPWGRNNDGTRDAALIALWYGRTQGWWVP